ncbi:MAG TPA: DUF1365 domain-containing protein [Candidatus Limnocylindria bacterium]|nr:DUF1365 domain-containing protein [Candidatus Limnocylindria bacterium]
MRSHLLAGKVRHRRAQPFSYALEHDVWYLAADLDELDGIFAKHRLISRNRRNLLSFHDADHWLPPATDLAASMRDHLRAEGFGDTEDWRITFIATPRVFGYQFNPASFYLARDADGTLRVVVVEVHNTHGERRLYTLRPEERGTAHVAGMEKDFYVSPFISMDAAYTVRVQDRPDELRVVIDESEAGERLLQASVVLKRQPLTERGLARMLVRFPFVTLKTIGLIHWHALRMWRRGATFYSHGAAGTR